MARKKRRKFIPYESLSKEKKWEVIRCMQNHKKVDAGKIMGVSQSTIDKICDELFNKNKNLSYEKF